MSKKENNTILFVTWIIEAYKRKQNMPGNKVVELFNKHSILEWLSDNYDALHTVSSNYVIEEIEEIIQNDAQTKKSSRTMHKPKNKDKKLFYLAIPGCIEKVVLLILKDKDFDTTPIEAITAFYASTTYQYLEKEETGFWKMPAKRLYEDFLVSTGRV